MPSETDAVNMLLNVAGLDQTANVPRKEAGMVVGICKRLPLTIGIAGKLIKQMALTGDDNWSGVIELLKKELAAKHEGESVEEGIIRASVKSVPRKIRKQVLQLFTAFALIPEDVVVPLEVIGMIYDACSGEGEEGSLPRLQIRHFLKVLIDRSLVMGTVDRPQLHDIVWEYVRTELKGAEFKAAQRRLVEMFRAAPRNVSHPIGAYMLEQIPHHITAACDNVWKKGPQAISWLEDHVYVRCWK